MVNGQKKKKGNNLQVIPQISLLVELVEWSRKCSENRYRFKMHFLQMHTVPKPKIVSVSYLNLLSAPTLLK
jgi:hypothetical protein